jgi:hypothetical protein
VWAREDVKAGTWSDPYLLAGYDKRGVHIAHAGNAPVRFEFEIDMDGKGKWTGWRAINVDKYAFVEIQPEVKAEWIRVRPAADANNLTMQFIYAVNDRRDDKADAMFDGIATASDTSVIGGLVRARGDNLRTLQLAAMTIDGKTASDIGNYELDGEMKLRRVDNPQSHEWLKKNASIPVGVLSIDNASVLFVDDNGKRWRLPKGDPALDTIAINGLTRIDREVATERDLFNAHGTFYELPAENAGGFAKLRPIATHNRRVHDYCSYRGLLIMTGISGKQDNPHIIKSDDGKAALWAGAVDDLWKLGKPRGIGGPWKDSPAKANEPSDPYLMTEYDQKRVMLAADNDVTIRIEVDLTGDGTWTPYRTFTLAAGANVMYEFPRAFSAYWMRAVADKDCTASITLNYR